MEEKPKVIEHFFSRLRRRRLFRRLFNFLKWTLFLLIFLLISGYFLLQSPKVQNYLIQKTTTFLSKELHTEVSIDHIDLDLLDRLVLDGFYLQDLKGDTLLYSQQLKADFNTSVISLLWGKMEINNIYLNDAQFNIRRDSAEASNNLQFLADYFGGGKKEKSSGGKPFFLDINGIYLNKVHFIQNDQVKGQKIDVDIPTGKILIDELNLPNNLISIQSISLQSPFILIEELPRFPAPEAPVVEQVVAENTTKDSPETETPQVSSTESAFLLEIDQFKLDSAQFIYHNYRRAPEKTTPTDIIDYNHLQLSSLNIDIDTFQFTGGAYRGIINNISLQESSGFELTKLRANQALVCDTLTRLSGLEMLTPHSSLGDTLSMEYNSFRDFQNYNNRVYMNGHFKNAKVALKDIMTFAPPLKRNRFFTKNQDEIIQLDGRIKGSVNRLRGLKGLRIKLGKSTLIEGSFSSRNLAVRNEEILNLKLQRLLTDIQTMRLLVPGFDPPDNYDKLGRLDFNGRFDGFFTDFVAYGSLKTDLGVAKMDMNMNLRQGRALANYTGNLSLIDFDLQRWAGQKDFGKVTFVSEVKNGVGLTLETVSADLDANIKEFTYRGYRYENLTLDGELRKNLFDGQLTAKDDNIDFIFNGSVDFQDSIPILDFKADVNKLDLLAINLAKQPIVLSGEVDMNLAGKDLSSLQGNGNLYQFVLQKEQEKFIIDTLLISSTIDSRSYREFDVSSEVVAVNLKGYFDVQEVPQVLAQYFERNFPVFAERFKIRSNNKTVKDSRFNFDIKVPDSKNFTYLLDQQLDTIRYAYARGYINNTTDSVNILLETPVLKFNNLKFNDILFDYHGVANKSNLLLDVYHTSINEKQHFEPLKLEGQLVSDTLHFNINSTNFSSIFDDLDLRGKFYTVEDLFQVSFLPSNLIILKDQWAIQEDNYIRFGKGIVETKNFDLQHFEKRIVVESIEDKGLTMSLENFDLSIIDDWWIYDKLDFDGKFYMLVEAGNVFKLENVFATAIADSFIVNGDNWGELKIDLSMPRLIDPIQASIEIEDGPTVLFGEGYVAPLKKPSGKRKELNRPVYADDFDFNFNLKKYPLSIIEYFLGNGVYNTVGTVDGDVRLNGKLKEPNINGTAVVSDLATTINYLKTRYYVPSGTIKINNFLFDATGNYIYDEANNRAAVTGGITHNHLRSFGLNVGVSSDKFTFLDTKKGDNDLYYGYGIGAGKVKFTGSFQQTDIEIDATTGEGTNLVIPIDYGQDADQVSFIRFENKDAISADERGKIDLRGVDIDMELDVTPDAEIKMIFDEQAGDIIRGRGSGNIQVFVTRTGDFKMYGDYEIDRGEYLFTLLNLVNKNFVVKKGGRISWDGDPFGALIDIEAQYEGFTTSVYNFIIEYLQDDDLKAEARASTNVDLTMKLKGELLQPDINFDIGFPTLSGELKNYADSKLRIIRQDQNELNRQVFGLMVIRGFLPNESAALQGTQSLLGINTVSELLTNQLSIYLTDLLSDVFTDVDFISGFDINFKYNVYQADEIRVDGKKLPVTGSEFELRQRFDLFDDRLSVDLGGSYINQSGAFFAGDVAFEYYLTKNRRLKVRFYRLTDQTIEGRRDKIGLGFSLRREFNTFGEFLEGLRRTAKKAADDKKTEQEGN